MAGPAKQQWDCRQFRIRSTAESADDAENLEVIVGPTWRLHRVSPLRNLQYTEARLKWYAMRLRDVLPSEEGSDIDFKVRFRALPELVPADNAPVPLQITVESRKNGNERVSLYRGIMLSWRKSRSHSDEKELVHLPVLLCKGGINTSKCVHDMLHLLFDCDIKDVTFEEDHLLWMLGLGTHFHATGFEDVHLRFICPGVEDDNYLAFTVQMNVLKDLWESIHGPDREYITYDQILALRDKCYDMLKKTYGFNLRVLLLTRIKHPNFLLSDKGHIKFSPELIELLLQFVQDVISKDELH